MPDFAHSRHPAGVGAADPIVHVMGCGSVQYGTFEDNLVALAAACGARGSRVVYAYSRRPASDDFVRDVEAAGGEVVAAPGTDETGATAVAAIARLILRSRPRVVHAHFGRPSYVALAVARTLGVPRLFKTQHQECWPALTSGHATVLRAIGRVCEKIVCVSQAVRGDAIVAGVAPDRLVVLPFGVDTLRYAPDPDAGGQFRAELGLAPASRLVVCAAHLRPAKGLEVLLDAWEPVVAAFPDAVLVLAGDGRLRGDLEQRASVFGASVRFLGVRQDVPRLLAAGDAVVCPSFTEGAGLGIIEAMSSGAALVSTRVGLLREGVGDGAYVAVARIDDAPALADGILKVLSDPALAASVSAAARAEVLSRFRMESAVAATADLYSVRPRRAEVREAIA